MYACLDIGGTSIKVAVSDIEGNLCDKDTLYVSHEYDKFVDAIVEWIEKVSGIYNIQGVAISSPGAVNTQTGIVGGCSAVPCIHGPNWKQVLKDKTNLPISIENDANCAALAEIFSGTAKDVKDVLFVVCGTGIGGAVVKDGRIHQGKNLYGGEFGCMIMEQTDEVCLNFSEIASTMSFVRKARKYYNDDSWNGERVFEEAEKGNEFCKSIIDTFYKNLAWGIFNIQHVYDPEMILLGGAISNRDDFVDKINEKLTELISKISINVVMPNINTCTHKKDANIIGALAHHINEYKY